MGTPMTVGQNGSGLLIDWYFTNHFTGGAFDPPPTILPALLACTFPGETFRFRHTKP